MKGRGLLSDWLQDNFVLVFSLMILAQENAEGHEHEKNSIKKNQDSLCTTRLQEGSEYYCVVSIKKANMIPVCISPAFTLEIWKCHHVRQRGNEFRSRCLSS